MCLALAAGLSKTLVTVLDNPSRIDLLTDSNLSAAFHFSHCSFDLKTFLTVENILFWSSSLLLQNQFCYTYLQCCNVTFLDCPINFLISGIAELFSKG